MPSQTPLVKKIKVIMRFGEALHQYGASSMRLEQALESLSLSLDIKRAQFFSTPTALMASFKSYDEEEISRIARVQPGGINLGKLSLVDELADDISENKFTIDEGYEKLEEIIARPVYFTTPILALGYGVTSLCFTVLLQATPINYPAGFFVGLLMGTISGLTYQSVRFNRLYEPLAAFIATIAAYLIAMFFPGVSVETVILAGLIPLVPGLALTLGLSELATNDLASGTTRIMGAITVFVKIFFGIIIGKGLMSHYLAVPLISTNYDPGIWLTLAAPLFASLGFSVMFRAQGRDRFWIVLAALISFTVFKVCRISLQMDVEFAAAIAGLILGAGSNLFARTFKRPASITLLPGLLLLVPGSFGFIALDLMGKQNLFEGISTFFEMFVIAMGLVSGLLLGNIVITPRRSL